MNKTLQRDQNGTVMMNLKNLKIICEREGLYQNPENNETLYLHFKGFDKIENLEPYSNLVALWLNNNALSKIEGLETLNKLVSLFLNHNLIQRIENLSNLVNLNTLNLSHNSIKKIENLSTLEKLQNLNLCHNHLSDNESLKGMLECPSISNLDLSNNHINYEQETIDIFSQTNIGCLYLKGNTIVRDCPYYRKTIIIAIKNLQFLDDKPVTLGERKISEAWHFGGKEAEQKERLIQIEIKREIDHQNYLQTLERQLKGEMRANLLEKQENICKEIRMLQVLFDDGEDVEEQLEFKQNELKQIESELEKYQVEQLAPSKCFLTTKDDEGNVVILNKTEEEAELIKEKYFNDEMKKINQKPEKIIKEQNIKDQQSVLQQEDYEEIQETEDKFIISLDSGQQTQKEDPRKKSLREWKIKREGWTQDHDNLLENLLMYHQFNFDVVSEEFKKIMALEDQNLKYLDPTDLKSIWTYIELKKYRNKVPENLESID